MNDRQDLLNGCSLDNFFDEIVVGLFGVRVNVNFGDPAKKIMNIAKDVLIGAHEKESQIIRLSFDEAMNLQRILRA